jgi:hypothetical protein
MTIKTRTNTGQSSNTMAAGVAVCARHIAAVATCHSYTRDRHHSRFGRPSLLSTSFALVARAEHKTHVNQVRAQDTQESVFQDPSIYPTSAVVVVVVVVEAGKVPQQVGAQPSSSIDVLPSFPSSSLLILMNGLYSTMPLFWVLGFDSRLGCSSPSWTRRTWRTAQSFHHRDRQGRLFFSSVALAVGVPSCIAQQSNPW